VRLRFTGGDFLRPPALIGGVVLAAACLKMFRNRLASRNAARVMTSLLQLYCVVSTLSRSNYRTRIWAKARGPASATLQGIQHEPLVSLLSARMCLVRLMLLWSVVWCVMCVIVVPSASARTHTSIADSVNYGKGPQASDLINPSRFADMGVDHTYELLPVRLLRCMTVFSVITFCTVSDFVEPRGQEEIRDLFASIGHSFDDATFDAIWRRVRCVCLGMVL
jgi:hypothetical protein